jgi:TonB family protein
MSKFSVLMLSLILAAFHSSPVQARDWGIASGWFVSSAGESCGMLSQSPTPGGTETLILKRSDGALFVQVKNPAWAKNPGQQAGQQNGAGLITYMIDNRTYAGPFSVTPINGGYIANFGEGFESELRGGSTLTVRRDTIVLDQIALTGSTVALVTLQNCVDDVKGSVNAAKALRPPRPKNSASSWITVEDYPGQAMRDRREGVVAFRLLVDTEGRVKQCTVTQPSGSSDLDEATCDNITKRARFTSGQDDAGNAVEGEYSSRVSWKLPE